HARGHRRTRLPSCRRQGSRPRPASDDLAPAGPRPYEADVQVPGPPVPSDRRAWRGREEAAGVTPPTAPQPHGWRLGWRAAIQKGGPRLPGDTLEGPRGGRRVSLRQNASVAATPGLRGWRIALSKGLREVVAQVFKRFEADAQPN